MQAYKKRIVQFTVASCTLFTALFSQNIFADVSQQWSPLEVQLINSSAFGPMGILHFGNNIFTNQSALGIELGLGGDEFRLAGTYGYAFTPEQRVKLTAEYMSDSIDYNFVSGVNNQRMGQYSIGAEYEYLLQNPWLNDFNFSGYLGDSVNQGLSPAATTVNNIAVTDYRNIAGAASRGLKVGIDVSPWSSGQIGLAGNYDYVDYDAKYQSLPNSYGLGYTISLTQLLGQHLKIDVLGSQRQPYDQLQADIRWLVPTPPGNMLEIGAMVSRVTGNLPVSGDNRIGLVMTYNWGGDPNKGRSIYSLAKGDAASTLVPWIMQPVIRAPQPYTLKDEALK